MFNQQVPPNSWMSPLHAVFMIPRIAPPLASKLAVVRLAMVRLAMVRLAVLVHGVNLCEVAWCEDWLACADAFPTPTPYSSCHCNSLRRDALREVMYRI